MTQTSSEAVSHFSGTVRVVSKTEIAPGTIALTLAAKESESLPDWSVGAHIDVSAAGMVRQYSLCGMQGADHWRIGVRRHDDRQGLSDYIYRHLKEGELLQVSEPRNNFPLRHAASYLFIAGGIGITPILPMIAEAEGKGIDWQLIYASRSEASMSFRDELVGYQNRIQFCLRDRDPRIDFGSVLSEVVDDRLVYACGPAAMLEDVKAAMAHWPGNALNFELFEAIDVDQSTNETFEIEIASSGEVLIVPADKSALEILHEAGFDVATSCGEGICGSCEVGVLEGEPEHRDSVLSDSERAENSSMMVCISRCKGKTVKLDL